MAAVTDLQIAPRLLLLLFGEDPRLTLIQATAWLDPLGLSHRPPDDDAEFNSDDEDALTVGLHVCRQCFPGIYAGANQLLLSGAREVAVKDFLCDGINAQLVTPLRDLEDLRYGPPLECFGIDLEQLADWEEPGHPIERINAIFALFGVTFTGRSMAGEWSRATCAAEVIRLSVENCTVPVYQDLFALLAWLFSASGNTLVDWSQEDLWESGAETADWTPEEVEFVNAMSQEACDLMASAYRGLDAFTQDAALSTMLARHLKTVFRQIDTKGKNAHARPHLSERECVALARGLVWPDGDGDRPSSEANADGSPVSVRDHPAPDPG
ncbi:MAG: hypothetical protein ACYDBJ_00645 [Aggregatilineales bacterium]